MALIASGQSSTITGTLAGQIVMEGFVQIRLRPIVRRLLTRALAIIPAVLTIVWYGERATGNLLVLSQVVLSLQLSFAVIPLIHLVSDRRWMGQYAIKPLLQGLAWLTAGMIARAQPQARPSTRSRPGWRAPEATRGSLWVTVVPAAAGLVALLGYVTVGRPGASAGGASPPRRSPACTARPRCRR